MKKQWNAPAVVQLDLSQTAHGWDAWSFDWSFCGLPLIGTDEKPVPPGPVPEFS